MITGRLSGPDRRFDGAQSDYTQYYNFPVKTSMAGTTFIKNVPDFSQDGEIGNGCHERDQRVCVMVVNCIVLHEILFDQSHYAGPVLGTSSPMAQQWHDSPTISPVILTL